jgi:Leucine-rich repeat (LRR) protein
MFIKKDLRKIPTILDEAVDCAVYAAAVSDDENDFSGGNKRKEKRTKREEPLKALRLGRRKQEFDRCVRVLCSPSYVPKLTQLEVLNLYDCDIHDLNGFGTMFESAAPNLETLNLGRNPLTEGIPDEFARVKSLKHLWLDDCRLKGVLPKALLHLPNLESLRLPNNTITSLEIGGVDANVAKHRDGEEFEFDDGSSKNPAVIPLSNLKILCLDRNQLGGIQEEETLLAARPTITTDTNDGDSVVDMDEDPPTSLDGNIGNTTCLLPSNLAEWAPNLEECFLRHNGFAALGVRHWPKTLKILQVSSNRLKSLGELVGDGASPALTHLYANGNALEEVPEEILGCHPKLERLVISHNPPLADLPNEVWSKLKDDENGDGDDRGAKILWQPNPNLRAPWAESSASATETTNKHVC